MCVFSVVRIDRWKNIDRRARDVRDLQMRAQGRRKGGGVNNQNRGRGTGNLRTHVKLSKACNWSAFYNCLKRVHFPKV